MLSPEHDAFLLEDKIVEKEGILKKRNFLIRRSWESFQWI